MPLNQAPTTLLAINACNDTSETGVTDRTLLTTENYGDQLRGLYYDLTTSEALAASYTTNGTLYSGRYRRVQVDSGATAANVKTGTIGLMASAAAQKIDGAGVPSMNVVTSYDQTIGGAVHMVVFLNAITPGNFGYVQELGVATVLGTAALQKATPAIGDLINVTTSGLVDDPTTQTVGVLAIGKAIDIPFSGGLFKVLLDLPVVQD